MKSTLCMMALAPLLYLTGCATIVGQATQSVDISSRPDGAEITVINSSGETVYAGTTPTSVRLKAGAGYFRGQDYTVQFAKAGCAPYEAKIKRGMNGWYIGNILLGGVIGFVIVDPLTGAMWNLEESVHADLSALPAASRGAEGLSIVTLDSLPDHLRRRLVRIN